MQVEIKPIEKIEIEEYEGVVYNLETENEEYIANKVVVHNCPHAFQVQPETAADCDLLWMG